MTAAALLWVHFSATALLRLLFGCGAHLGAALIWVLTVCFMLVCHVYYRLQQPMALFNVFIFGALSTHFNKPVGALTCNATIGGSCSGAGYCVGYWFYHAGARIWTPEVFGCAERTTGYPWANQWLRTSNDLNIMYCSTGDYCNHKPPTDPYNPRHTYFCNGGCWGAACRLDWGEGHSAKGSCDSRK